MIPQRLLNKVEFEPTTGCWLWIGHIMKNGYGQAWWDGKVTSAHRAMYQADREVSLDRATVVDHLCRTPRCVNPFHLQAVTNHENLMRGIPGEWSRRTHCKNGHPWTPETTYKNPGNRSRVCTICRDEYNAEYMPRYYREITCARS